MISAGIDCGAKHTKTVIMEEGRIVGKAKLLTGFDQAKSVKTAFHEALEAAGLARCELERIGGTGSGKNLVQMADVHVNEVKAMAKGARYFFPNCRTAVDVGAEEARAVSCDEDGNVLDFAVNERCAAGAGAFIEAMARALEVDVEEMGRMCLQSERDIPMNAQCVIFAETEVIGLIHARTPKPDISRAIHNAIASRIVSMTRRIGLNEDVVLIGGVARNPGFLSAVRRGSDLEAICVPEDPEYGAAVGAAVAAGR